MLRRRVLLVATAFVAVWCWWSWPRWSYEPADPIAANYAGIGASLRHGVPSEDGATTRMPLATLWADSLARARRPVLWGFLPDLLTAVFAAAVAAVAGLPLPWLAGLVWLAVPKGAHTYPETYYALFILLVAGLSAARARASTRRSAAALGLAIGVSLLFRGVLAFLPPLIVALEWRASRMKKPAPEKLKQWAILLACSYGPLAPWILLNAAMGHGFVPLEYRNLEPSLALAALGFTHLIEGGWPEIAEKTAAAGGAVPFFFAEVAAHPLRYLSGVGLRLVEACADAPVLLAAAAAGAAAARKSPAARAAALVAALFYVMHAAVAARGRYYPAVWPLLCVCALGLLARGKASEEQARLGRGALEAGLAVACLAALAVLGVVERYRLARPWTEENGLLSLIRAAERSPDDAWLANQLGLVALREKGPAAAAPELDRASRLEPGNRKYALDAAWARALQGERLKLFALPIHPQPDDAGKDLVYAARAYRASVLLRGGRPKDARAELLAMARLEPTVFAYGRETDLEREALELLRQMRRTDEWRDAASTFLHPLGDAERDRVLALAR